MTLSKRSHLGLVSQFCAILTREVILEVSSRKTVYKALSNRVILGPHRHSLYMDIDDIQSNHRMRVIEGV